MHDPLALFLRRLTLRSQLNSAEQAAVLALPYKEKEVAARRDFVVPGQHVDHSVLMVSGSSARYDQMRGGHRQIGEFFIPGDMCDLASVIAPRAGWGLTAISPVVILEIRHTLLRDLMSRYPNIALAFWRDTTADAGVLAKWVSNIGRKLSIPRIAHLLCEMGIRMEAAGLGSRTSYKFLASQEQIGDAMGLTPVHVNRTLKVLRESNIVSLQGHHVQVHDWVRLVEIGEFDELFLMLGDPQHARLTDLTA